MKLTALPYKLFKRSLWQLYAFYIRLKRSFIGTVYSARVQG
jgi:hypothetical protein